MISVRMTKDWEYEFVDLNNEIATRRCPKGLVLEFDEEVAAAAVAQDAAETMRPQSHEFAERVRVNKRFLDLLAETGDADEAGRVLLDEEQAKAAEAEAETAKAETKAEKRAKAEAKAKADADAVEAAAQAKVDAAPEADPAAEAKTDAEVAVKTKKR